MFSRVTIFADKLLITFIGCCTHISVNLLSKRYLRSGYKTLQASVKYAFFLSVVKLTIYSLQETSLLPNVT